MLYLSFCDTYNFQECKPCNKWKLPFWISLQFQSKMNILWLTLTLSLIFPYVNTQRNIALQIKMNITSLRNTVWRYCFDVEKWPLVVNSPIQWPWYKCHMEYNLHGSSCVPSTWSSSDGSLKKLYYTVYIHTLNALSLINVESLMLLHGNRLRKCIYV